MTVLDILKDKFLYENVQLKWTINTFNDNILATGIVTSIGMYADMDDFGIYMFLQNETRPFKLSDNDFNITIIN